MRDIGLFSEDGPNERNDEGVRLRKNNEQLEVLDLQHNNEVVDGVLQRNRPHVFQGGHVEVHHAVA